MELMYYLLIFLCIFQDLPLANYIGDYGRSIVGLLSAIILFGTIIRNKKIFLNKTLKILIGLCIYLLFYNIILFVGYYFFDGNMLFLGESILGKTIKIFMYYFTNILFLTCLYQIGKKLENKKIIKPFYFIYFFLFICLIIEYVQLPESFPLLHATRPLEYNRIRLFTNESSNSSTIILVFFTLALQYSKEYKNKLFSIIICVLLLVFIYTTTAKSLILTLGISGLIMILFNNKVKLRYKIIIILMAIFTLCFLSSNVFKYFELAGTSSTTLYTRGYTYIIALLISIKYPFGVGNTLYLKVFTNELLNYLEVPMNIIYNFNAEELMTILNSGTDKNISAYSGILQYGIYWGIIGNIVFVLSIWKSVKLIIKNNPILFFGFNTILISIILSISLDNKFEIWAFIFVLMIYSEREKIKNE